MVNSFLIVNFALQVKGQSLEDFCGWKKQIYKRFSKMSCVKSRKDFIFDKIKGR